MGSSPGNPQSVPSLSHREAEGLISARLDSPLSSRQEQALTAHLQGCDSCRAFASSMGVMSAGFSEIPRLPASPTVSRQVRERIRQPQSIWDRLGLAGGKGVVATIAAAAAMLIIVVGAWSSLGNNGSGSNDDRTISAAAAQASDVAQNTNLTATQAIPTSTIARGSILTPADTTPTVPNITAPEETPTTEVTATNEVSAAEVKTATVEPTKTLVPTETAKPAPTDTAEPTSTRQPTNTVEPEATATSEPTETARPTYTATPEDTATDVPAATKAPKPTKTPKPKPTATEEDTSTAVPEDTATEVPEDTETATEEPAGQPTIGAVDDSDIPTEEATAIEDTQPADEPTDEPTEVSTEVPTEDDSGSVIEPINTPGDDQPTAEDTEDVGGDTQPDTPEATIAVLDNSQTVTGLGDNTAGAPVGPLMFNQPNTLMVVSADLGGSLLQVATTADGGIVADLGSAAWPIWSPQGIVLLYQDQNNGAPSAAIYDSQTGSVGPVSVQNDESWVEEIPVGWSGTQAFYLRLLGDSDSTAVLYGYDVNTFETTELWRGTDIEMSGGRGVSTPNGFLIPTADTWMLIGFDGTASEIDTMTFPVTGAPILSPFEKQIMYPSGTQLVVALIETPGTAQGALIPYAPNAGAGYSWEPNGDYVAVSDGASITVYDNFGTQIGLATSDEGVTIAGPQWNESGIYFLETGPSPSLRLIGPDDIPGYSR